jgi:hypothetical protein
MKFWRIWKPVEETMKMVVRLWTAFQTHYFSENLVAPGIEPGPIDL